MVRKMNGDSAVILKKKPSHFLTLEFCRAGPETDSVNTDEISPEVQGTEYHDVRDLRGSGHYFVCSDIGTIPVITMQEGANFKNSETGQSDTDFFRTGFRQKKAKSNQKTIIPKATAATKMALFVQETRGRTVYPPPGIEVLTVHT